MKDCQTCPAIFEQERFLLSCLLCSKNITSANEVRDHKCHQNSTNVLSSEERRGSLAKYGILCNIGTDKVGSKRRKDHCFCKECEKGHFVDLKELTREDFDNHYRRCHQVVVNDDYEDGQQLSKRFRKTKNKKDDSNLSSFYCHLCKTSYLGQLCSIGLEEHFVQVHGGNRAIQNDVECVKEELLFHEDIQVEDFIPLKEEDDTWQGGEEVRNSSSSTLDNDSKVQLEEEEEEDIGQFEEDDDDEDFEPREGEDSFEGDSDLSDKEEEENQDTSERVKCPRCDLDFKSGKAFRIHFGKVHQPADNVCNICHKVLKTVDICRKHILLVHSTKRVKCKLCDSTFKNEKGMREHLKNLHDRQSVKCDKCERTFIDKGILRNHVRTVHGTKKEEERREPKTCDICQIVFRNRYQFNKHFKDVHLDVGKIDCGHCDRSFMTQSDLRRHMEKVLRPTGPSKLTVSCPKCPFKDSQSSVRQHLLLVHLETNFSIGDDDNEQANSDSGKCVQIVAESGDFSTIKHDSAQSVLFVEEGVDIAMIKDEDGAPRQSANPVAHNTSDDHTISSSVDLKSHDQTQHSKALYCKPCDKSYNIETQFRSHVTNTHGPNLHLICPKCPKEFKSTGNLEDHLRTVHKRHKCPHCGIVRTRNVMREHLKRKHYGESLGRENVTKEAELDHPEMIGLVESSATIFTCQICGLSFDDTRSLDRHTDSAHACDIDDRRRVSCPACFKRFSGEVALKEHARRIHSKDNVKCLHCEFRSTKPNLLEHVRKEHLKEAYPCETCGKKLKDLTHLKRHNREYHLGSNICPNCGKTFSSSKTLRGHIRLAHERGEKERDKKCPKCDYVAVTRAAVRNHVKAVHDKIRDFVCHLCGDGFSAKVALTNHSIIHHEGEVVMDEKTGKRVFPCKTCKKVCTKRSGLGRHMMRQHGLKQEETIKRKKKKEVNKVQEEEKERETSEALLESTDV